MKTTAYTIAAAIALFSAASAYAAPQSTIEGPGDSVQVNTARPHYHMLSSEFKDMAGTYELETGHRITFSQQNHRFYATVDNEAPAEMMATAPNNFATANGVQVKFSADDASVGITNYERLPMSVAVAATGRVITAGR
ncbi:hypothetical protein [Rugamonas sp.]|uniref:hypothetical protein n=1 Tax=Rugamonas sp. TaxID=1926287 RepID=UPI0025E96BD8|nr:hypothetical protein [Rugamonas sp.]